ncbi:hypothetical protein GCM10027419_53030 [Pandoraea terrae]
MADNAVTQAGFWGMHMKIEPPVNPLTGLGTAKAATERTGAAGGAAGNAPANQPSATELSASPLASQMRDLQKALAQSGSADIDVARVAEIKQAIAEGRLSINPDKIASGLIDTARELLSTQKSS